MFEDADVISAYSRAQAIEDGQLYDVTETAKQAGFTLHTVVTGALQGTIDHPECDDGGDPVGRLWDVLSMARLGITIAKMHGVVSDRVPFKVTIGRRVQNLVLHVGPGDDPEAVCTIGYPIDF